MIYAGLDIGTTGSKITLFNDGTELNKFYKKYECKRSAFKDEIDANLIYDAVIEIINKALDFNKDLEAIGVTSFGETFVLLDKKDNILLPSMLYDDIRGEKEVELIKSKISPKRLGDITGLMVHSMYSLPKLLYIKNNLKKIYSKIDKVLLIEDFIVYKLTKVRNIDFSLASRTMLFNVNSMNWDRNLFRLFDLDENLFSTPVPTGSIAGEISDLNIKYQKSIKVINVAHDQISVSIGANLVNVNEAVDGCGTCECIIPLYKKLKNTKNIYLGGYGVVPYINKGEYVSYPLIFSGGALIEWFMNTFNKRDGNSYEFYENNIKEEPSNLIIIPHYLGSGTPFMNPNSKGMIYGLDISTDEFDIYKGVLEGITYEILYNINILKSSGIKIKKIYATGGSSSNEKYMQIKADILNIPIVTFKNKDSGTVGSAVIVGKTMGVFDSIEEGCKKLIEINKTFIPNKLTHNKYMKIYRKYKSLVELINNEEK